MTRLAATLARLAADPRADGPLLLAFRRHRDEAAFAEVVRRHAPLVWGVCRRTLPDPLDAEDAFQATFLVLVRRAGVLTGAATVGPWLYRVAVLTANRRRRTNARRLARRRPLPDAVPDPRAARPDPALDADAVLLQLPERERAAVVLCCLGGLTHREAAGRLGCAEGTGSARGSRGLARLRRRLAGRDPLAVLAVGAGPPALPAAVSPSVLHLTRGVLRMFWVKKLVAAGMVLAAVAGAGVAVRGTADDPAPAELEQRLNHLHDLQRKLDVHRAELDAAVRQAKADLQRATARAEPRLVVRVGGRSPQSLPPVTVTEYRGDQPSWTAEFPRTGWTDPDWTPVREYLRRARQAAGGPQAVTVEMPTHGPTPHLRGVLAACRDAGFEAGRITAPPLPAPVAVVEAEGGGVAGDRLTLRVGGTARVAIREGELITHYIEEVHASRPEVARVTILRDVNAADIRGLAPGTTDVTMTDRTGLSHHLRVTVTAK